MQNNNMKTIEADATKLTIAVIFEIPNQHAGNY
jgi:hypothetical protein